jgi:hypothetical protein
MAYQQNKISMGYVPTHSDFVAAIASHFQPPDEGRLWRMVDPCAGKGLAIKQFATAVGGNCRTYGIELDIERAKELAGNVHEHIAGGYEEASVGEESFDLLFLNPPYDYDTGAEEGNRLEYTFLRDTMKWLKPDGWLIYIVRQVHLDYELLAKRLARNFDGLKILRAPVTVYEKDYQQIVVIGRKRAKERPLDDDTRTLIARVRNIGAYPDGMRYSIRPTATPEFKISPASKSSGFGFVGKHVDPLQLAAHSILPNSVWLNTLLAVQDKAIKPAITPRLGHIKTLVMSGALSNETLSQGEEQYLIKGHTRKVTAKTGQTEDEKGRVTSVRAVENPEPVLWTLDLTNAKIEQVTDIGAFMDRWQTTLERKVLESYPPLVDATRGIPYKVDELLNSVGPYKRLPRAHKNGMVPAQRLVTFAAWRVLTHYGFRHTPRTHGSRGRLRQSTAGANTATGSGKTIMSLGVVKLLLHDHIKRMESLPREQRRGYRVVVLTDEQLPPKWKDEILEALTSSAYVELAVRDNDGRPIDHFRKFMNQSAWPSYYDRACILVVPKSMAKLAALRRYVPVYNTRKGKNGRVQYLCPSCGLPISKTEKDEDGGSFRHEITSPTEIPDKGYCDNVVRVDVDTKDTAKRKEIICNGALWQWARWDMTARGPKFGPRPNFSTGQVDDSARRMFVNREGRRDLVDPPDVDWPIAELIGRLGPGHFDCMIVDEAHNYNSADSDQAVAYRRIFNVVPRILELTASPFNGTAQDLFLKQYLQNQRVRRDFGWNDSHTFQAIYGRHEIITSTSYDDEVRYSGRGAMTGNRRQKRTIMNAIPGVMPGILSLVLPRNIFLELEDFGTDLAAYRVEDAICEASDEVVTECRHWEQWAKGPEGLRKHRRAMASWYQALFNFPNTPWYMERITMRDRETGEMRLLGTMGPTMEANDFRTILPKEEWLCKLVEDELKANRGVGVYVWDHERGLQERISTLLTKKFGPNYISWLQDVDPLKRLAWLKKYGKRVLVTNPRKVMTGIDLLQYPTLIFYQPVASLVITKQGSGRAWRLPQRLPCMTLFPYYHDTMEQRLLGKVYKKLEADRILTGSGFSSGDGEQDDGGSLINEVVRDFMEGRQLEDLGTLMRRQNKGFWSPAHKDMEIITPEAHAVHPEHIAEMPVVFTQAGGTIGTQLSLF